MRCGPRKSYGEPTDTMLRELSEDVAAGRVVRRSREWWSRYQAARGRSAAIRERLDAQKLQIGRSYYERHRTTKLAAARAYRVANSDRVSALKHDWYMRNRARLLAKQKRYAQSHRAEIAWLREQYRRERAARAASRDLRCTFTAAVLHLLGGAAGIATLPPLRSSC